MTIHAQVWNKKGVPVTIDTLRNDKKLTRKNKILLRNKLIIKNPTLDFFKLDY